MADFPSTLPLPIRSGASLEHGESATATEMADGNVKHRQTFNATPGRARLSWELRSAQAQALLTFLAEVGADPFNMLFPTVSGYRTLPVYLLSETIRIGETASDLWLVTAEVYTRDTQDGAVVTPTPPGDDNSDPTPDPEPDPDPDPDPPVDPDPDFANVFFQSGFFLGDTGLTFDESNARARVAANDILISDDSEVFGERSAEFTDRTSSKIEILDPTIELSSSWTVDFSWTPTFFQFGDQHHIFNRWLSETGQRGIILRYNHSTVNMELFWSIDGATNVNSILPFAPTLQDQYDIRIEHDSVAQTLKTWINGTILHDESLTGALFNVTVNWAIGAFGGGNSFDGFIDRVRMTSTALGAPTETPAVDYPQKGNPAGLWSMYSDTSVVIGGNLYHIASDESGAQILYEISGTDLTVNEKLALSGSNTINDGLSGSVVDTADGNILVLYNSGGADSSLRLRLGATVPTLGAEVVLSAPGSPVLNFVQSFRRNNEIFVFTRAGVLGAQWVMFRSTDNGATWQTAVAIFEDAGGGEILCHFRRVDANTIRATLSFDPSAGGAVLLADIDLASGDVTAGSGTLGNFRTEVGLPVMTSEMHEIVAETAGRRMVVLDASDDGGKILVYDADADGVPDRDGKYLMYVAPLDPFSAAWAGETVFDTVGVEIAVNSFNAPGACFNRLLGSDHIIVANEVVGVHTVQRYQRISAGSYTAGAALGTSNSRTLARPISPAGATEVLMSLHQEIGGYTSATSWSQAWGIISGSV